MSKFINDEFSTVLPVRILASSNEINAWIKNKAEKLEDDILNEYCSPEEIISVKPAGHENMYDLHFGFGGDASNEFLFEDAVVNPFLEKFVLPSETPVVLQCSVLIEECNPNFCVLYGNKLPLNHISLDHIVKDWACSSFLPDTFSKQDK